MVDTGMHLRQSHLGSERRLLLGPTLPLVGLAACLERRV